MLRILAASSLLAFATAMVTDVKKEFPTWPNAFSFTVLTNDPYEVDGEKDREIVGKVWYDGDGGKVRKEYDGRTVYALRDYNGRKTFVAVEKTGECKVSYEKVVVESELVNPLPQQEHFQFVGEFDINGEKVEQWQYKDDYETANIYLKQQDGFGVPLRLEYYPEVPPFGSDIILPATAEVKDFSTSKPDASLFDIDASKCKEVHFTRPKFLSFLSHKIF